MNKVTKSMTDWLIK